MSTADISGVAVAVVVIWGAMFALIAWFYRRGGQEQAYTSALDRNTKAAGELAVKLDDFKVVVLEMFHTLDKRITRLEDKVN